MNDENKSDDKEVAGGESENHEPEDSKAAESTELEAKEKEADETEEVASSEEASESSNDTPSAADENSKEDAEELEELEAEEPEQSGGSEDIEDDDDEEEAEPLNNLPEFGPGDTVKVHLRVKEGNRERMQIFEGVVIAKRGSKRDKTFTVRKISFGVGVEKIFPEVSPVISKLEIVSRGDVRRAKLYYLRDRVGKAAKVKQKREN